jgi:hypothetical protein
MFTHCVSIMKTIFVSLALILSISANAQDNSTRINYETEFVPLNTRCDPYFSLNPPGQVCLNGMMYFRVYNVEYKNQNRSRSAKLTYIPERRFEVDSNGAVKQRNHSYRTENE